LLHVTTLPTKALGACGRCSRAGPSYAGDTSSKSDIKHHLRHAINSSQAIDHRLVGITYFNYPIFSAESPRIVIFITLF
jgi:hypothetical protein